MFDYYDEYLSEPSELDIIIGEMKDKLHNIITSEAKNTMEEYMEAKEKISDINADIIRKKNKLIDLDREIKELENKYENIEKYKMPRKYIDSFVREYTGSFAPGDKVFIVDWDHKYTPCDKCKGEKKVTAIIDGEELKINCLKCKGHGTKSERVKFVKKATIDRVDLRLCFNSDRVNVWSSEAVRIVGDDYTVNPDNIFSSYEEAEKSIMK